jgi:hypothetical protein
LFHFAVLDLHRFIEKEERDRDRKSSKVKGQFQWHWDVEETVLRWKKSEDSMDAEVVGLGFRWAF